MFIKNPKKNIVFCLDSRVFNVCGCEADENLIIDSSFNKVTKLTNRMIKLSLFDPINMFDGAFIAKEIGEKQKGINDSAFKDYKEEVIFYAKQNAWFNESLNYINCFYNIQDIEYKLISNVNNDYDISLPIIFLPLVMENKPNGAYMFGQWFCLYDNGRIVFDSFCKNELELEIALKTAYAISRQELNIKYIGDFILNYKKDEIKINLTKLDLSQEKILNLVFQYIFQYIKFNNLIPPAFNNIKYFYHTKTFWAVIYTLGACIIILLLPLLFLLQSLYLESSLNKLESKNNNINSFIKENTIKSEILPKEVKKLESTSNEIINIKNMYQSRLEIVSIISKIISKHMCWIELFELSSELKNDTQIHLVIKSNHKENLLKLELDLKQNKHISIIESQLQDDLLGANLNITLRFGNE